MIVVLDSRALIRWSSDDPDPSLHRPRLELLLEKVTKLRGRVVLPTPVVAEFLVCTNDVAGAWLSGLERKAAVHIAPFDRRAAVDCALLDGAAIAKNDKRGGRKDQWQRVKIDRQIVAIARTVQASLLVTDDAGMRVTALAGGLEVSSLDELELPASARQFELDLPVRDTATKTGHDGEA